MNGLYYSSYGSDQDQYPHMLSVLEKCSPLNVGVELAIYTRNSARPQHIPNLLQVKEQFAKYPTLFHGPFFELEATSEPDSEAAAYMKESYEISYDLCRQFHAPSIVMHTNQISYEDKDKLHLQDNSRNMIIALGEMARAPQAAVNVAAAKLMSTELACEVTKSARQIHGANGLSRRFEVERCLRDAQMLTIAEGTSEICKIIIASSLTSGGEWTI